MEIRHTISFNTDNEKEFHHYILESGIKHRIIEMPGGKSFFVQFVMNESDSHWPEVSSLIEGRIVVDVFDTYFSTNDILRAEWAYLVSTFTSGYPQPLGSWVTNPTNYKMFCPECGIYLQKHEFLIKAEPALKGNDFMTLNWVTNTFFCTPEVLTEFALNNITGYEAWDVLIAKTHMPSQKIRQLFIPNVTDPGLLEKDDLMHTTCSNCGLTRFSPHLRGMMNYSRSSLRSDLDIVRSYEWFGSGKSAFQEVFVSNRVAKLILKQNWKGVRLKVLNL